MQRTRLALTFLCMLFFLAGGWVKSTAAEPAANPPAAEEAIRAIRQSYAEINARTAKCRVVKKDLVNFSSDGGPFVAYFDGDTLIKIELTYYGDAGETAEEYYYVDGKLVFLYQADSAYTQRLSGKVARTERSRFYFRDDVLISWVGADGKAVPPGGSEYQEKQKECLQNARGFAGAARSPQPTVEATW